MAEALAERAGRHLDAGRDVHGVALGVARRQRAPLAKLLDLVERNIIASEVQQAIQQHRPMPGRQDKAVSIKPPGVFRIMLQETCPQDIGERGRAHR